LSKKVSEVAQLKLKFLAILPKRQDFGAEVE
jgi:hypothetical protein